MREIVIQTDTVLFVTLPPLVLAIALIPAFFPGVSPGVLALVELSVAVVAAIAAWRIRAYSATAILGMIAFLAFLLAMVLAATYFDPR